MHLSHIPKCTILTEMCTFLFWMVHCGILDRCIVGFVNWDWFLTLHLHLIRPEFIVAYDITNITINSFSSGDASRHHHFNVGLLYIRTNFFPNIIQCHFNLSKFLPNPDNSSLMMARYGLSVVSTTSDLYFASVTAMLYAIYHVHGLMQERCNSTAIALELRLSSIIPSM